jgi:hypothetical protein
MLSSTCFEQPSVHHAHTLLWHFFHAPVSAVWLISGWSDTSWHQLDCWYGCIKNTIKLYVQDFLRMNTWLSETCQRQYNWIKSLMTKLCILLVRITYVFHNLRFKKRKISVDMLMYHEYGVVTDGLHIWLYHAINCYMFILPLSLP